HSDGSLTTGSADRSITKDAEGRITEVSSPDKTGVKIEHGPDGKPNRISEADDTHWQKGPDGTWIHQDKDGKEIGRSHDIQVRDNGDIACVNDDGSALIRHPDGSSTDVHSDLSVLERDKNGHITEITDPKGKTVHITNDQQGDPQEIKGKSTTWTKGEDGTWTQTDNESGEKVATAKEIRVDKANGDIVITNDDSSINTFHSDGTIKTERPDKAVIERDADQNITEVTDPRGRKVHITNDSQGNPKEIKGNSTTWTKGESGVWSEKDNKTGEVIDTAKDVQVNRQTGDIVFTDNDNSIKTFRPNGSSETIRSDNSVIIRDIDSNVTHVTQPDGKSVDIAYDEKGNAKEVKGKSTTWTRDDADGGWTQRDNKTGEVVDTAKDIQISKETGEIAFTAEDNSKTTFRPDGTSEVIRPDQSAIERDAQARVSEV